MDYVETFCTKSNNYTQINQGDHSHKNWKYLNYKYSITNNYYSLFRKI